MEFALFERILFLILLAVSLGLFITAVRKKLHKITSGMPDGRFDNYGRRTERFISEVIGQSKVIWARPAAGLAHALVFWGFLVFSIGTIDHFLRMFGLGFLQGTAVGKFYAPLLITFSCLVLAGILYLAFRRYVLQPTTLTKAHGDSGFVIALIAILMITYLLTEVKNPVILKANWWVHALGILVFLVYIPMSKHTHLMAAPFGVFFKNFRLAKLRMLDLEDFDKEDFGVNLVKDLTWKDNLDGYACILCGRCSDMCPAFNTDKTLNPKEIIQGVKHANEEGTAEDPLIDKFIPGKAIWQCTTCGGCEFVCPTADEHLQKIIGLRRYQVAESNFPPEAQNVFKGLEKNFNPWNYSPAERADRIGEFEIPIYEKGAEWLLWMGCFASYDQSYAKSSRALIDIFKKAGVSFGVMETEPCCGDPARRLGNEMIYQAVAEQNVQAMKELGVTKIVTACPHCAYTIEHDYKDYGADFEVYNHTAMLRDLLKSGNLSIDDSAVSTVTFHDPCYMSRYKKDASSTRELLDAAGVQVVDPKRSGSRSFCCGGGGGAFFLEESEGTRINHNRMDELSALQKDIVVACPFCRAMLTDAAGDKDLSETIAIKEISEILVDKIRK